jgi:phospholipase C
MRSIFTAAALLSAAANAVLADNNRNDPPPEKPKLDDSVQAALKALGRKELRNPGSLPDPKLPAGTDTMPEIENIIVLMMENHSYDNMIGMLGRGDGYTLGPDGKPTASNPYANGTIQHAFRMPNTCQLQSQPSQTWFASHNSFNNGTNDGFVSTPINVNDSTINGAVSMGYYIEEDLPTLYSLAKQFPIADRWFSSALAPTFPNRMCLLAGTSMGIISDDQDQSKILPPRGTIVNALDKFNISYKDYVSAFPSGSSLEIIPLSDNLTAAANFKLVPEFFTDVAAGKLPRFSFLEPNYTDTSQENPQNVVKGDAFISDIVNAIGNSPLWLKTIFILTYDEHGGYFDHVIPPPALKPDNVLPLISPGETLYEGFQRYGFRVPTVVVSPYAKKDYVSSMVYDHTSILAFIEKKFNLPFMTFRDANANDMMDFIDVEAMEKKRPTFPKMPRIAAPGNTTAALKCSLTGPGVIPPPGTTSPPPKDHGGNSGSNDHGGNSGSNDHHNHQ